MAAKTNGNRKLTTFNLLFAAMTIAYPFLIFFSLNRVPVRVLACGILGLALLRLALMARGQMKLNRQTPLLVVPLAGIGLMVFLRRDGELLLYYPVVVSTTMLILFGSSLIAPPTVIERFARLREPELNDAAIAYCRKVTLAWCLFFVVNGSLAALTALWGDMRIWTFYNGLISYLLMGLLFAIEWLVRQRVRRAHAG